MKDMTVETLNFIILCMGLLFVMAGILLIVGKLAGKRLASIAFGVLMIAWGLLCGIPELRSWMLARATDLEHTLEAMWAGLDGDGQMLVYIFALWLSSDSRNDLESGLDGLSTTLPRHPRSAITDASHVDSSKKDTVGKESKKHES